jgi:hypothetical protein
MLVSVAQDIPQDLFEQHLAGVHRGNCPKCNGPGPVDVHTSHLIWSVLFLTSWNSKPQVCCRSCGVKSKLGRAALSGVVGWWGIPWGIIGTPVQIGRNLIGVFKAPNPNVPSDALAVMVRLDLAQQIMQRGATSSTRPDSQVAVAPQPGNPQDPQPPRPYVPSP